MPTDTTNDKGRSALAIAIVAAVASVLGTGVTGYFSFKAAESSASAKNSELISKGEHSVVGTVAADTSHGGWNLAGAETGNRSFDFQIQFPGETFHANPQVAIFPLLLDIATQGNTSVRYELTIDHVTTTGATIHLRTWADTKIFGAKIGYIAVGP